MGPDDPVVDGVTQQIMAALLARLAGRAGAKANARIDRGDPLGEVEEDYNTLLFQIETVAKNFGITIRSEHREK
jgi:hypothetical protein